MQPLVSILIGNYNYARFLSLAIDSALSQSYANVEVIVVDDGSSDESRDVISSYGDRIVAVLKENGGQASTFNAGFAASRGDIICFLDSDDLFVPGKIAAIHKVFEERPEIGWCFDRIRRFNHGDEVQPPLATGSSGERVDLRQNVAAGIGVEIPTVTSGISIRRNVLAQILPMPDIIRSSDGYLKLAAVSLAEGWILADEVTLQRIHGANIYTNRPDGKKRLMSKTGVVTGICLYEHFSHLRRFGVRLFSRGLGTCYMTGGLDSDTKVLIKTFWAILPLQTKAEVLLRVTYWSARDLVLGWPTNEVPVERRNPALQSPGTRI